MAENQPRLLPRGRLDVLRRRAQLALQPDDPEGHVTDTVDRHAIRPTIKGATIIDLARVAEVLHERKGHDEQARREDHDREHRGQPCSVGGRLFGAVGLLWPIQSPTRSNARTRK
jgi:hypothetical protein